MSGAGYKDRRRALSLVRQLLSIVRKVGYDHSSAVEIVECLLEEAEKDGLDVARLWSALDSVAPIPKDV